MPRRLPYRFLHRTVAVAIGSALSACGGGGADPVESGPEAEIAAGDDTAERAHPQAMANTAWLDERHVVVEVAEGFSITTVATRLGGKWVDRLGTRPIYLVEVADTAKALGVSGKDIVFVEPNRVVRTPEQVNSIRNSVSAIGRLGNVYEPWAEKKFDMARLAGQNVKLGAGVKVAVLDTGVDLDHPKLASRIIQGRDFIADDGVANDEAPLAMLSEIDDSNLWAGGHGTHVAGVIAKVAPAALIMPVRVLDAGGRGTLWTVAKGVVWAIDPDNAWSTNDGASVLNLSLGTTEKSFVLQRVIEIAACGKNFAVHKHPGYADDHKRCATREAVVFAGAGNDKSIKLKLHPAADVTLEGLAAVTASGESGTLADFANSDLRIRLAAPGDKITSTFADGGDATMSGTSMATPWASGTAALMISNALYLRQCNTEVLRLMTDTASTTPLTGTGIREIDPVAAVRSLVTVTACP